MKIIYLPSKILKPSIFLDRDGVINKDVEGKYITSIKDVKIYKSAIEGLKKINLDKYHLIIITNQSAINRGLIDLKQFKKISDYIIEELNKHNIKINAVYFCPHRPEENCKCRKPKTGLIEEAILDYKIDIKKSFFVGDKKTDIDTAKSAGIKSIFVGTGQAKNQRLKYKKIEADITIKDLRELKKYV
ncbi:MAG: HAD family hydrolase [Elusimicrobiota bacterium]